MSNKINFIAKDSYGYDVVMRPYPASEAIPQWWKDMSPYIKDHRSLDGSKLIVTGGTSNAGPKKCTPMLDSLTSGYIIPLWADIQIRADYSNGQYIPIVEWKTKRGIFEAHSDGAREVQSPVGYTSFVAKFLNYWIPQTPKGYSIMVDSPYGYRDLPIKAVPGIVDTDKPLTGGLLFPVWFKEGFEGIVEKGTPLVQITPFKRENWKAEFSSLSDGEFEKIEDRGFEGTIVGHYLKNIWTKKIYK